MPVVTDGGAGTGVEALGCNYPFVAPSDDVKGLLADFYLSHSVRTAKLPLRIAWLHGFCHAQSSCLSEGSAPSDSPDPVHDADLVVKDADGLVVFDSTAAATFRSRAWGERFRLYEWVGAAAVCRALVHTGDPAGALVFQSEIAPENGVLDERTHDLVPGRLTSLTVNDVTFAGEVEFLNGYNVALTKAAPVGKSRRARTRVLVAAAPGGGLGRFPSCEEPEVVIRRINGVGPNATGGFIASASGCYWLERPVTAQGSTATVQGAALRLNNNCGPCCECADYENTYQGVRRLYSKFKSLGQRGEAARDLLRENIARWRAQKECRKADPVKVVLGVTPGGYVSVAIFLNNADDDCKYGIDLSFTASHNQAKTGSLVPYRTTVTAAGGTELKEPLGGWPTFTNFWEAVGPGRALALRTLLLYDGADVVEGDSVTVTAAFSYGGTVFAEGRATVALYPIGVST